MSSTTPDANPASRSGQVIAILTSMVSLSAVVLATRLTIRLTIQRLPFGADDWTIIAAWIFSLAFTVDVCTRKWPRAFRALHGN
jgi:hypothetical protein